MEHFDYEVLITGQLSTNNYRYPNEKRDIICSTTLVSGQGVRVLVDPGWREDLLSLALKKSGVHVDQIDLIYATHLHPDHFRCASLFPKARWLASRHELTNWQDRLSGMDKELMERFQPVEGQIIDGLSILETPGHTLGHTSVLFKHKGQLIIIAADAVLAKEYYEHVEVHPISENPEQAKDTIKKIKALSPDWIIPGHDEPFKG
jgi:glyoxylase-like metal-dependent hydrolase (beta-lactamase superfamily II)